MIKRIDHTGYVIKDLQESISYFRDVVGLTLRREFPVPEFDLQVAFMGLGEEGGAEIELMKFQNPEIPIGFRHLSLIVTDIQDYYELMKQRGANVTMLPRKISAGMDAMMIKDPNGITIEILQMPE